MTYEISARAEITGTEEYYFSVEANSEEEAIELVKNNKIQPYDSTILESNYSGKYFLIEVESCEE